MLEVLNDADMMRQHFIEPNERIIVAYDEMNWNQIRHTANEVGDFLAFGKTNSAHVRNGAEFAVNELASYGQLTMLDSKFHDIPSTVKLSVKEATLAGAALITVHASGGTKMLEAAAEGAEAARQEIINPLIGDNKNKIGHILGITVLTSLEDEAISIFGLDPEDSRAIEKKVLEFARKAKECGLTGIVCSALESRAIREDSDFDDLLVVTPGITPSFAEQAHDQRRTASPTEAFSWGADYIVVGRGINKAMNYGLTKLQASQQVAEEVEEGLQLRSAA